MKIVLFIVISLLVIGSLVFAGFFLIIELHKRIGLGPGSVEVDIIRDEKAHTNFIFSGKKEDIKALMEVFNEGKKLADPALDLVGESGRYYVAGEYDKAEAAAKIALSQAKEQPVMILAHSRLVDTYEAGKQYDLALQEVNWLLSNVPDHAKSELFEKKSHFEKLLAEQKKLN